MSVAYTPYTFAKLPKWTRAEVALHQTALACFGQAVVAPTFAGTLQALVRKILHVDCSWSGPDVRVVAQGEVVRLLGNYGFFALVGTAPSPHKIVVDIDPTLAAWSVERLLGGRDAGAPARLQRAPTDLELGVFSHVLLELLAAFDQGLVQGTELAPRLDRLLGSSEALAAQLQDVGHYVGVGLRVQLGERMGYVRILLPEGLMQGFFGAGVDAEVHTPQQWARVRRCLAALPERTIEARVVGARLQLTPDDIANVEPGDIIVLEDHALHLTPEGVRGDVQLLVGEGRHGSVESRLVDAMGETRLQVVNIAVQQQLEDTPMDEAQAPTPTADAPAEPQDNLPQTAGLLREVDASVAVELGRIRLNTAQLVRLRSGQILRLARGAHDPVDLVVGGKLFARGELIEVDGELGVRLLQVTGES